MSKDRINIINLQPSKQGKCFLVPTELMTSSGLIKINTLLDSGASGQFISPKLVRQLNLPKYPLPKAMNIFNADGTINQGQKCTHYTKINVTINNQTMVIEPRIVQLGTKPLFLGITWLRQHNPDIDWENATLKWRDEEDTLQLTEFISDQVINLITKSDYDETINHLIVMIIPFLTPIVCDYLIVAIMPSFILYLCLLILFFR